MARRTTTTANRVATTAATTQQVTDRTIVRRYFEHVASTRARRSRRTPAAIQDRLAAIDTLLPSASTLGRLQLVQQRIDLQAELATANDAAAASRGRSRVRASCGLLRRAALHQLRSLA